jgi:hypothetical protein
LQATLQDGLSNAKPIFSRRSVIAMGFAEPVIGRRFAPTRWLNPSYGSSHATAEVEQVACAAAAQHLEIARRNPI